MTTTHDLARIRALVLEVLAQEGVSLQEPPESTPLLGGDAGIDSFVLVAVLAEIEARVRDELGASIVIADERAMSQKRSPFRRVDALIEYVAGLIPA
jgi:hypothetical protein